MSTLNVLVIDDELGMRLGVKRILESYQLSLPDFKQQVSFSVEAVETGAAGLEILKSRSIDILILDHKLPDILGLEVLSHIEQHNIDVLTIMITAFASLEVAISATKSGAYDFLAKPFTPEDLRYRIDKAAKHIFLHRRAQQLEEEKKQVRFQFISVLAHELKAPLAAIDGYLNLMERKIAGNDLSSYENMIERSKLRISGMFKMIMDLLDLTRIESGNKKRNIRQIDVLALAKNSVEAVMLDAEKRKISLQLHAPEQLLVQADEDEFQIILNNLLTNAVKYNRDEGKVDLYLMLEGGQLTIKCCDTGIGMSPEELERLFSEFFRIKNSKTKNILGSGLGLSILKKIVDLYNGEIKVESTPDVGTNFILILNLN